MRNDDAASTSATRPRAPRSAYVLTAVVGLAACAALAGITVHFGGTPVADRPMHLALSMVVYAPVAFAVAWFLFVARHTAVPEPHAEDGVERGWLERATSAAFLDLLTVLGLALAVLAIGQVDLDATTLLLVVVPAAMADVAVRYLVLRRRES